MASGGKRLDLQFGSFACSVQGFDDPVTPVQQVLQAMQLAEKTDRPALGVYFAEERRTLSDELDDIAARATDGP